jgi:hypothetical protein
MAIDCHVAVPYMIREIFAEMESFALQVAGDDLNSVLVGILTAPDVVSAEYL